MDTKYFERKIHHQRRAFAEEAVAPELRANREAPFRGAKRGIQLANLKEAHRRVVPFRNDREAQVPSRLALANGPGDESLEAVQRSGRRRDESRHFFRGQQREQGLRIARPELAKRDAHTLENRQALLPIGGDHRGGQHRL